MIVAAMFAFSCAASFAASIRLDGPNADGKTITMNLDFPDTKQKYLLVVQYGRVDRS